MSAAAASAMRPERAPSPPRPSTTRRLRAVEAPTLRSKRPRLAYAIVALTGAIAIGAAQMVLSIGTTQGSYELAQLNQEKRELTWEKQALYDDVAGLSSPQYLAANAAALGMVINEAPSYLRLSDGAILGPSEVAMGSSSVDAIGRGAVANALITDTPLVTVPDATIDGVPVDVGEVPTGGVGDTPPPLTDGLPTPSTH
jgi:hypothetical protein